jgi:hypothetical protein
MDANTPATQPFPGGNPIASNPIASNPIASSPIAGNPIQDRVNAPARPKGPNASAIVVGLLAMFLAGLIIANETIGVRVDWSRLGPGAIVGVGVVMVVLGAVGLIRRRDDA